MQNQCVHQNDCEKSNTNSKQLDKERLKKQLTPLQYMVTQEKVTERPYTGEYLKLKEDGMYCCIVCGETLFSSECKYDSGCGWPSFYDVTNSNKIKLNIDVSHVGSNLLLLALKSDVARTEVSCKKCNAHLGHLFRDGPKPTGNRYCVNSASLKFDHSNSNAKRDVSCKKLDSNETANDSKKVLYCVKNGSDNRKITKSCSSSNAKSSINVTKKILMETHL